MTATIHSQAVAGLNATIQAWEKGRQSIDVLEAGGGSLSRVTFSLPTRVTAVDISQDQLDRNTVAHARICADLHTVSLAGNSFDAAVCYDVIEHLQNPKLVISKLIDALKPGGILILAAPNRRSLQGLITKLSPHWFHVFVYRHIFKSKTAGLPGHAPFPTVYDPAIDPDFISGKILAEKGATCLYLTRYESGRRSTLRRSAPLASTLFEAAIGICHMLGMGQVEESDFFLVARKNGK